MSLQLKAIDRLFERLGATYGASWDRSFGAAPVQDVKSAWAHELAGFSDNPGMLAWALENLPEKCPNIIEFRNLARRAPTPDTPRLPEPKADPERVKAELAKLGHKPGGGVALQAGPVDHKAWAKRIIAKHDDGIKLSPTTLRFAREALGIPRPSFANQ